MMLEDRSSQQTAKNRRKTLDSLLPRETHLYTTVNMQKPSLTEYKPKSMFLPPKYGSFSEAQRKYEMMYDETKYITTKPASM